MQHDAAVAAEETHPADIEACSGWLYGQGLDWVNVTDVDDEDAPADLKSEAGRRYAFEG